MCLNQGVQGTSGSSDLPLSESFHVACRLGIVYSDNPICCMYLQVLAYSTVVHVLKGFPQFFNCPNELLPFSDLRNVSKNESVYRE